jgi:hypothetical protein
MTFSSPYIMLMASLPPLGDLFGQQQTPFTEVQLRHRLRFLTDQDSKTLSQVEQLVRRSKQPADWTDGQIVRSTKALLPHLKSETLKQAVEFVINLRTIVAALRRRKLGEIHHPRRTGVTALGSNGLNATGRSLISVWVRRCTGSPRPVGSGTTTIRLSSSG